MVPDRFGNFLLGSAGASAALIGLLFVAVSLAPERVFGGSAVAEKQTEALSAFTALANAFFISLGGLIPGLSIGSLAAIISGLSLGQTATLLLLWPRWKRERRWRRAILLVLISAAIYAGELRTAQQLLVTPGASAPLTELCIVLLAAYAIGLGRAWSLLGEPQRRGLWAELLAEVRPLAPVPIRTPAEGREQQAQPQPQAVDDAPARE